MTDETTVEFSEPRIGFAKIQAARLMDLREEMLRSEEAAKTANHNAKEAAEKFNRYARYGEMDIQSTRSVDPELRAGARISGEHSLADFYSTF